MDAGEGEVTLCPWCGTAVPVPRQPFPGPGQEGSFLRCPCGAIGLPTLEPKSDRLTVAEKLLGVSRRLWVELAWGLEKVEWRTVECWSRLHKLEELISGPEVWVALVWGRRR
jgi:hypothetical protein